MARENNVVLDETIDENWEPTFEEIQEYAVWLGMNKDKDKDLFYIAKEGLKAPLPPPWKPCKTAEGEQPLPLLRALGAGEGVTQLAIVGEFITGASLEMRRHDCVQRGRFHLFFLSRFSPCGEFSSPLHEFNQTISIIAERRIVAD